MVFRITGADIQEMAISMEKTQHDGAWVLRRWWPNLTQEVIDMILSRRLVIGKDNKVRVARRNH